MDDALDNRLRLLSEHLRGIAQLTHTQQAKDAAAKLKELEKDTHKSRGDSLTKLSDDAGKIATSMTNGVRLIQAGKGVEGSAEILKGLSSAVNCVATLGKLGSCFPPPAGTVAAGLSGVLGFVSVIMELQAPQEKSDVDKTVAKMEQVFNELLAEEAWTAAKAVLDVLNTQLVGLRAKATVDFHTENWANVKAASTIIGGGGEALELQKIKHWLTLLSKQETKLWNEICGIWLLAAKKYLELYIYALLLLKWYDGQLSARDVETSGPNKGQPKPSYKPPAPPVEFNGDARSLAARADDICTQMDQWMNGIIPVLVKKSRAWIVEPGDDSKPGAILGSLGGVNSGEWSQLKRLRLPGLGTHVAWSASNRIWSLDLASKTLSTLTRGALMSPNPAHQSWEESRKWSWQPGPEPPAFVPAEPQSGIPFMSPWYDLPAGLGDKVTDFCVIPVNTEIDVSEIHVLRDGVPAYIRWDEKRYPEAIESQLKIVAAKPRYNPDYLKGKKFSRIAASPLGHLYLFEYTQGKDIVLWRCDDKGIAQIPFTPSKDAWALFSGRTNLYAYIGENLNYKSHDTVVSPDVSWSYIDFPPVKSRHYTWVTECEGGSILAVIEGRVWVWAPTDRGRTPPAGKWTKGQEVPVRSICTARFEHGPMFESLRGTIVALREAHKEIHPLPV